MGAPTAHERRRLRALVGQVLRDLRIEAGYTQVEVAARLGRAQSYVSKYESGELRVDLVALREICGAIGIPMVDLVERVDLVIAETTTSFPPTGRSRRWTESNS